MQPCPENWMAIWRAVVYHARTAHALSAGIKCQHCVCGGGVVNKWVRLVISRFFLVVSYVLNCRFEPKIINDLEWKTLHWLT